MANWDYFINREKGSVANLNFSTSVEVENTIEDFAKEIL